MSEKTPYDEMGFKCGLEIHQQLACGKLFCSCQQDESDSNACSFFRLLSVSKSETGEEDLAASFEKAKSKSFQYVAPEDSSCLVECDEEPPHNVNDDAVKAALEAALLFGMRPLDCIQFMRKIVVDGSNTSGFQRTALIARGGRAEGSFGKIGVSTLCLEEDSCRIESREHHGDVYNLSRLGIPLLEICTEPDITSPKQARECAEQIGLLVRSISAVKRGLGTIRQDINISVKGGSRVEIKGAQDLYLIEKLAEYEAERQLGLLRVKDMLGPVDISKLRLEIKDVSSALNGSESKVIRAALEKKGKVLGTKLAGMKGILGIEIAPGKRVGSEISDYAKAAAGVKGLFHADELPAYGITGEECKKVSGLLGCSEQDSFVIIADDEIRAAKALEVGFCRALMLFESVPEEVRQARPDGSSSFMRPMPGSARMYPETDVPYIITDLSDIFRPKPITEKISEAVALGIEQQAAKELLKKGLYDAFMGWCMKLKEIKPGYAASLCVSKPRELKRANPEFKDDLLDEGFLKELLFKIDLGEIPKESADEILLKKGLGQAVLLESYKTLGEDEIEKVVLEIKHKSPFLTFSQAMGEAMKELRGKADGKKVAEAVKRHFK